MWTLCFLLGLAALLAQPFLSDWPWLQARPYLVALPVTYAALRWQDTRAFLVAAPLGLLADLFSAQGIGCGALSFSVLVIFILAQREFFKFEFLPHALVLTLLGIFLSLVVDYLWYCGQSELWNWPFQVWVRLALQALTDMVLALPFYAICDLFFSRKGDASRREILRPAH